MLKFAGALIVAVFVVAALEPANAERRRREHSEALLGRRHGGGAG
jgi:hypothetical protein